MAFAIVHFTVGFVIVLAVLSLISVTGYRLTGGYAGGVLALGPDVHHLLEGSLSEQTYAFHNSPRADVFFFHHSLEGEFVRANNVEFTFVSLVVLGTAFAIYDWRFGGTPP